MSSTLVASYPRSSNSSNAALTRRSRVLGRSGMSAPFMVLSADAMVLGTKSSRAMYSMCSPGNDGNQESQGLKAKEKIMAGWAGNPSFDLFQLPEEHQELRGGFRALAEKETAPRTGE